MVTIPLLAAAATPSTRLVSVGLSGAAAVAVMPLLPLEPKESQGVLGIFLGGFLFFSSFCSNSFFFGVFFFLMFF